MSILERFTINKISSSIKRKSNTSKYLNSFESIAYTANFKKNLIKKRKKKERKEFFENIKGKFSK